MAICQRIQNRKKIVCTGAMKHRITIINRKIEPADTSYNINRDTTIPVHSMVEVITETVNYNNVNIENIETHTFRTRISPALIAFGVQKNYSVQFKGKYYIVVAHRDLNEEGRFYQIKTVERGLLTKESNW